MSSVSRFEEGSLLMVFWRQGMGCGGAEVGWGRSYDGGAELGIRGVRLFINRMKVGMLLRRICAAAGELFSNFKGASLPRSVASTGESENQSKISRRQWSLSKSVQLG